MSKKNRIFFLFFYNYSDNSIFFCNFAAVRTNINVMTELVVQVEDTSLLSDIRRAIKMLRGVGKVSTRRKKTELLKAIEEADKGELHEADSVEDLIKQLHE